MSKLERLQRAAMRDFFALITPDQETYVRFVEENKLPLLSQRLEGRLQTALEDFEMASRPLESELSKFLQTASVRLILECVSKALRSEAQCLRLPDVKTEVLVSWLAEIETSSSSSVLVDGDSGDSVAADPRNNGTPDTSEKGVNGDA